MSQPAYPLSFPEKDDGQAWPAQGRWTYEDYLRLPNDDRRFEVIRGHLYVSPSPGYDHQFAVVRLTRWFDAFVSEHDLGVVLVAPFDIRLPRGIGNPVQPDLLFLRKGNHPRPGDRSFTGIPDLVVEVLSPGTRRLDGTTKLAAYRDAGVKEFWRVDPASRHIAVYLLSTDGTRYEDFDRGGVSDTVTSSVLPGIRIPVAEIFPPIVQE